MKVLYDECSKPQKLLRRGSENTLKMKSFCMIDLIADLCMDGCFSQLFNSEWLSRQDTSLATYPHCRQRHPQVSLCSSQGSRNRAWNQDKLSAANSFLPWMKCDMTLIKSNLNYMNLLWRFHGPETLQTYTVNILVYCICF